jgi:hypothetical protein
LVGACPQPEIQTKNPFADGLGHTTISKGVSFLIQISDPDLSSSPT